MIFAAIKITVQKCFGKTAGADVLPGFFRGKPAPVVDLPVGVCVFFGNRDRKVQHQRVGTGIVAAVVERNRSSLQPEFFKDFAYGSLFGVFPFVDVTGDQHIGRLAVLLDQNDAVLCRIHDQHADGGVEYGIAELAAGVAVGDFSLRVVVAQMQAGAALHAVIHFGHICASDQLNREAASAAETLFHFTAVEGEVFARHQRLHTAGKAAAVNAPGAFPFQQRSA